MATTPNYGWVTPAPTDFVTDLPADFETFADAADASVKALNPGTTAGDVDYYTSSTAKARLAIGTAGQVLTVNSGATAPEWATISAGGMTLISTINASGASSVTFSSIPQTYKHLLLVWGEVYQSVENTYWKIRFNSETSGHNNGGVYFREDTAYPGQVWSNNQNGFGTSNLFAPIAQTKTTSSEEHNSNGEMWIYDYTQTTEPINVNWQSRSRESDGVNDVRCFGIGMGELSLTPRAALTQIDFIRSSTQTLTGTFRLYGVS